MGAVRFDLVGDLEIEPESFVYKHAYLPFTFMGYDECWVNINGTITFEYPAFLVYPYPISGEVWPTGQANDPEGLRLGAAIAGLFSDHFINFDPLDLVYIKYGNVTYNNKPAFSCTWNEVTQRAFDDWSSGRSTFQIIFTEDLIEMNYDKVGYNNNLESPRAGFYFPELSGYDPPLYFSKLLGIRSELGTAAPGPGHEEVLDQEHVYPFRGSGTGTVLLPDNTYTISELIDGGIHALSTHSFNSNVPGRYIFGNIFAPPLRQRHRDDGLATDTRQEKGRGTSRQSSLRQGGRVYY